MDSSNDFKGLREDAITLLELFSFNVVSLIELSRYLIQWGSTAITLSIYSTTLSIIRGKLRQGMSAQGLSLHPRRPSRDGVAPNDADRRDETVHVGALEHCLEKQEKQDFSSTDYSSLFDAAPDNLRVTQALSSWSCHYLVDIPGNLYCGFNLTFRGHRSFSCRRDLKENMDIRTKISDSRLI